MGPESAYARAALLRVITLAVHNLKCTSGGQTSAIHRERPRSCGQGRVSLERKLAVIRAPPHHPHRRPLYSPNTSRLMSSISDRSHSRKSLWLDFSGEGCTNQYEGPIGTTNLRRTTSSPRRIAGAASLNRARATPRPSEAAVSTRSVEVKCMPDRRRSDGTPIAAPQRSQLAWLSRS